MASKALQKWLKERGSDPWKSSDLSTGGLMPDEHLKAMIVKMKDRSAFLRDCRTEIMRSATKVLDLIDLPDENGYSPDEGTGATTNLTVPTTDKKTLTAHKFSVALDYDAETMEDSIEGGDLESTLLNMISTSYGNQVVNLGFNGDTAAVHATPNTQRFRRLMDGWLKKLKARVGSGVGQYDMTGKTDYKAILSGMYALVNARYKDSGMMEDWQFQASVDIEEGFTDQLAALQTPGGDEVRKKGGHFTWKGVPVVPRGYLPARTVILTPPKNLAWGIKRQPKTVLWYDNDLDKVRVRVHSRIDFSHVVDEMAVIGWDVV